MITGQGRHNTTLDTTDAAATAGVPLLCRVEDKRSKDTCSQLGKENNTGFVEHYKKRKNFQQFRVIRNQPSFLAVCGARLYTGVAFCGGPCMRWVGKWLALKAFQLCRAFILRLWEADFSPVSCVSLVCFLLVNVWLMFGGCHCRRRVTGWVRA